MTPQEMWNKYKQINPSIGDEIDAWAFGVDPDLLAELVFKGEKTATASAYDLRCHFRQSRSACLHRRSYKGFRSAFSSSVRRPCL